MINSVICRWDLCLHGTRHSGRWHFSLLLTAKILDINPEKERITLGVKQLTESAENNSTSIKKGAVVCGIVSEITPDELILDLPGETRGTIRRTDLSREKQLFHTEAAQ